jgi:RNA polymerase sigma-70 factor (ECF subfamily)
MEGRTRRVDRMDGHLVRQRFQADDETVLTEINDRQSELVIKALERAYGLQFQDASAIFNLALQELWEKRHSYEPDRASVAAFLFTIASRRAIDHLRRENRDRDRLRTTHLPDWSGVTARVASPGQRAEPSPEGKAVLAAYDALPAVYREIVRLDLAADGVASSRFVAQVTGIPEAQVPVYRRRARERLRRMLKGNGDSRLGGSAPIQDAHEGRSPR